MKILITGSSGFLGQGLLESLRQDCGREVHLALHRLSSIEPMKDLPHTLVGEIRPDTNWRSALQDCQAVIHCAARVHLMGNNEPNSLAAYRVVNTQGTINLARQAAEAGVGRFVFISSIKVNGEETMIDTPFTADDNPKPLDAYAISKFEAEQGLWSLADETGMEIVIIRPPLIYGPGVKGNFESLMRWLYRGLPLPFGAIRNKRSLVSRSNLVDLIATCLDHPAAANQVFLAGDGEDLSTTELLHRTANALGKPARLVPVPVSLLEQVGGLLGKRDLIHRLCGSLYVDIGKTRSLLEWQPPVSVDDALEETARAFLHSHKSL
jgi:nucleoside-diphosphate-sugar epimerase